MSEIITIHSQEYIYALVGRPSIKNESDCYNKLCFYYPKRIFALLAKYSIVREDVLVMLFIGGYVQSYGFT